MRLNIFLGMVLAACLAGCNIGNVSGVCKKGTTCTCDELGNCDYACETGGGCHFVCKGTGNCNFDCKGNGCDATCQNTGNCILKCTDKTACTNVCSGGISNCSIESP